MKNHPKTCVCTRCNHRRLRAYERRVEAAGLELPTDPERLVPVRQYVVRAHYRRNPTYLKSNPDMKNLLMVHFFSAAVRGALRVVK